MKAMLSIDHPAWAHQFRQIVKMLNERGDEVLTLCVDKDGDKELLDPFPTLQGPCDRSQKCR